MLWDKEEGETVPINESWSFLMRKHINELTKPGHSKEKWSWKKGGKEKTKANAKFGI